MSSLTRRMQIRGLKRLGYRRTKFRIEKSAEGQERPIGVSRGGLILTPEGERAGYSWPRRALV